MIAMMKHSTSKIGHSKIEIIFSSPFIYFPGRNVKSYVSTCLSISSLILHSSSFTIHHSKLHFLRQFIDPVKLIPNRPFVQLHNTEAGIVVK